MLELTKFLLARQGIDVFRGCNIGRNDIDWLHDLYGEKVFRYGGPKQVIVVVSGIADTYYIVDDFDQMWRNRKRFRVSNPEIKAIFRMPPEIWEEVRQNLDPEKIVDLTVAPAET